MKLNYIIDGLIDGIKDIREHNHGNRQSEIYNDLDKQSELINELIQLSKQPSLSDAEDTNNRLNNIYIKTKKIQELQKLIFELERKNKLVIDSILKSDFSEYAKNNLIFENLQNFEDRIEFLTTEIDDRATEVMNLASK
ncbi:hypothetical protein [Ligilactobacillus salivarius]|uniref:Uncharacterized protein n=1 Tax=Ligilactobacillus salivarius str. Ren TaxID=1194971 RepID=A0A0F7PVC8_9LACO|nr:hypothetical protein [Ligilactobacillus salivarius]AKI05127.1 hypothetical protein LsR_01585 [Ligilactobacillus salivarius str. Ren]